MRSTVASRWARPAAVLFAMMIGKEHPFDLPHTNLSQMIQHAAVAQINEKGAVIVLEDIHIARVLPQIDAWLRFLKGGEYDAVKETGENDKATDHVPAV